MLVKGVTGVKDTSDPFYYHGLPPEHLCQQAWFILKIFTQLCVCIYFGSWKYLLHSHYVIVMAASRNPRQPNSMHMQMNKEWDPTLGILFTYSEEPLKLVWLTSS